MKIQRYFNVLVEHKLLKSDLDELLKLLIIEEDYEYAGLVKEMIDIGHYDNNSEYNITESEKLRTSMISSLRDLSSTIEDINETSSEENDNLDGIIDGLKNVYLLLDERTKKANEKEIKIVYPEFKTNKYTQMFQEKADEYISIIEDE